MTPARFDIMYLLRKQMPSGTPRTEVRFARMRQKEIRAILGLSATTISKMITRMIELGLLTRHRATEGDRRCNVVQLTVEGIERIHQALGIVFNEKPLRDSYDALVRPYVTSRPKRRRKYRLLSALDVLLRRIMQTARHLGDLSAIAYPLDFEPDH